MLSALKYEGDLDGLANQLSTATALTPDLIHNVIVNSCTNLPVLKKAEKVANFDRLVEVGAWCDAVACFDRNRISRMEAYAELPTKMANGSAP